MTDDLPSDEETDRMLRELDEEEHRVERGDADEAYRFHHQGAFGDYHSVLIERRGAEVTLTARSAREAFGRERRRSTLLTPSEWDHLVLALHRTNFFDMPQDVHRMGLDGVTWDIEGRRGGHYRLLSRWCPEPGDPFHDLGLVFLELAGVTPSTSVDGEETGDLY